MKRLKINISGIVQGVGFRPFVYNMAAYFKLGGHIFNNSAGVEIEIEGETENVDAFVKAVREQAPPLAVVSEVKIKVLPLKGEKTFTIKNSDSTRDKIALVSPDVATCADCEHELKDRRNRRYGYPFINCTNCGPRYSIIKDVPYDRQYTTMSEFSMCSDCQQEYDNPADRRFHAQPNACQMCGPVYRLLSSSGQTVICHDIFSKTRTLIKQGNIIAIKGIGGYHLACDAFNETAVAKLRSRKIREDKPFAVMAGSLAAIHKLCHISDTEEIMLNDIVRPIVLLNKKTEYDLAASVAPNNPCLGVMLPYAPIHWLLLDAEDVWVMTSGNTSDEPIVYEDNDAIGRLAAIADYFLCHNRQIYRRVDDSVVRAFNGSQYVLRRSRGIVPSPIRLAQNLPAVLAAGGELKNTFCLTRGNHAFLSPHVGDLENLATYDSYIDLIRHFKKLFDIKPEIAAYDLHPEYLSTKYVMALNNIPKVGVQHHHAHIAAVMAENGLDESVIGVAYDGTGYGPDGTLWGGEFLITDLVGYVRAGHLRYMRLPGGAKAIKEPWRVGIWLLNELYGKKLTMLDIPFANSLPPIWEAVTDAASKGLNAPLSSGAGRLFDAAAALLNIRSQINYEGQAAVELELAAAGHQGWVLPYDISGSEPYQLDLRPAFAEMIVNLQKGISPSVLAACFHTTLASATADVVKLISSATGIKKVALSGGVWQNITLLTATIKLLNKSGLNCYIHHQVPPNDGGLSLGQAIVAGSIMQKGV